MSVLRLFRRYKGETLATENGPLITPEGKLTAAGRAVEDANVADNIMRERYLSRGGRAGAPINRQQDRHQRRKIIAAHIADAEERMRLKMKAHGL